MPPTSAEFRARPAAGLLAVVTALLLSACGQTGSESSGRAGFVDVTVNAPLGPGGIAAPLGLPVDAGGVSPVRWVKLKVYRAEDAALERPLRFDETNTLTETAGTPHVELRVDRPSVRLRLPAGRYRFETVGRTAPDGAFLAYGQQPAPDEPGLSIDAAHPSVNLMLRALTDERSVGLTVTALQQIKAASRTQTPFGQDTTSDAGVFEIDRTVVADEPLRSNLSAELSLRPVSPEVEGRRFRVPLSDVEALTYEGGGVLSVTTSPEERTALGVRASIGTVADAPDVPFGEQAPRLTVRLRAWVRTGPERAAPREIVRTFYARYRDETFTGTSPGDLSVTSPVVFRQAPFVVGRAVPPADTPPDQRRLSVSFGNEDEARPLTTEPVSDREVTWRFEGAALAERVTADRVVVRPALTSRWGVVFEPAELPVVDLGTVALRPVPGEPDVQEAELPVTPSGERWWTLPLGACAAGRDCTLSWPSQDAALDVFGAGFTPLAASTESGRARLRVPSGPLYLRVRPLGPASVVLRLDPAAVTP